MATKIALVNQKGGCGKSSTAFHLGGQLASGGERVLLVDTDPQGSLSQAFFGPKLVEQFSVGETLAAAFRQAAIIDPTSLVAVTAFENLDIVCANHLLAPHNTPEPETLGIRQYTLDSLLARVGGYDWVLIDCPPNLYACTWNALLAADEVLVPVPPEDFGTQGLLAVHQAIEAAQKLNPRLGCLGHLITRRDARLLVHRAYEEKLRSQYDNVLATTIPEAVAFKVALTCRTPVGLSHPASKAAGSISNLADEIRNRVNLVEQPSEIA